MHELEQWFEAMARIGMAEGGGFLRASYTQEESECYNLLSQWMEQAGLTVRRDAVGNLWGRIEGSTDAPPIVTGSHMDSVRNGGNYDGVVGVLGGLRAVRDVVQKYGKPRIPLEVVAFTGEEGSRFSIGLMGSHGATGSLDPVVFDSVTDAQGISLGEAMKAVGLDPSRAGEAVHGPIGAYLEMHIEQGPVLEQKNIPIGIVQSIVGCRQFRVTIRGEAGHAGTVPMAMRKDPLQYAARAITRFPGIATNSGDGVITVGNITAKPGADNVIPDEVVFTVDIRHPLEQVKQEMAQAVREVCEEEAHPGGREVGWSPFPNNPATAMNTGLQNLMRQACDKLGYNAISMPSGAGHDAINVAKLGKVGLLFIPCKNGRSHCPEEYAKPDDIMRGVSVLSECIYALAYT